MKLSHLAFAVFALCLLSSCSARSTEVQLNIEEYEPGTGCNPMDPSSEFWKGVEAHAGFHAPWQGLDNGTDFRCVACGGRLYFRFEAVDSAVIVADIFDTERVVDGEDRVEVFFSPTPDMSRRYYCAEVDPLGRVMDYSCDYYRKFDYGWGFSTIATSAVIDDGSYKVVISLATDELESLGLDMQNMFLGVFQADFNSRMDDDVNWFSLRSVDLKKADFHIPDILIPAKIHGL